MSGKKNGMSKLERFFGSLNPEAAETFDGIADWSEEEFRAGWNVTIPQGIRQAPSLTRAPAPPVALDSMLEELAERLKEEVPEVALGLLLDAVAAREALRRSQRSHEWEEIKALRGALWDHYTPIVAWAVTESPLGYRDSVGLLDLGSHTLFICGPVHEDSERDWTVVEKVARGDEHAIRAAMIEHLHAGIWDTVGIAPPMGREDVWVAYERAFNGPRTAGMGEVGWEQLSWFMVEWSGEDWPIDTEAHRGVLLDSYLDRALESED